MLNQGINNLLRYRPLAKCFFPGSNKKCRAFRAYASFAVRDILYEKSDEVGTLTTSFAKYIAIERQGPLSARPTKVRYADYFPISDLRYFQQELHKTPSDQLPSVITFAYSYRPNADPAKFACILNELDDVASRRLDEMDVCTILRTLYAFVFLIPNWMSRLHFYGLAMNRLVEKFNDIDGNKENLIQTCFYLGLNKKHFNNNFNASELLKSLLDSHLNKYMDDMKTFDIAIISNAAYKTATRLSNEKFNCRLIEEVLKFDIHSDYDAILINFLKSMRLERIKCLEVCEYLAEICQDPQKINKLQPKGQIHLFAYLAENLWDDKRCTLPLMESFFKNLSDDSHADDSGYALIRGKDISTFLWCCAQLNCGLNAQQFQMIENALWNRRQEFERFPDQLVDCCLSMCILGHKSKDLLMQAIDLKLNMRPGIKRQQPKVDSRLVVLLSAVQIEEPSWKLKSSTHANAFDLESNVPTYLLNSDEIDYTALTAEWSKQTDVEMAKIVCPIRGINIPGFYVKFKNTTTDTPLLIEVVPTSQTLRYSQDPIGIVRLKIRLLQALNYKVAVITNTKQLQENRSLKEIVDELMEEGNEYAEKSIA